MQIGTPAAPIDARLSPVLGANGGRLPTLALRAGSPALNAGREFGTADQRGAGTSVGSGRRPTSGRSRPRTRTCR